MPDPKSRPHQLLSRPHRTPTIRRQTQASTFVTADPDAVFARVSNHEGTPSWVPKVRVVELIEPGEPTNGVPALRRVTFKPFGWGTIDERITAYSADERTFSYTITAGMTGVRDHLGTVVVEPAEGGCWVTWSVWFDFNPWLWTPFAGWFVRTFTVAMQEGLDELARQSGSDGRPS